MTEREEGFYWVLRRAERGWEIAEWFRGNWWLIALEKWFKETDFRRIDERRIEREERDGGVAGAD